MTNWERVVKLQDYQVRLVFIKRFVAKERNLNTNTVLAKQLKEEIISIARDVDKLIGLRGHVENEVIKGFSRSTKQIKMGINYQIKVILERIEDVITIFNK